MLFDIFIFITCVYFIDSQKITLTLVEKSEKYSASRLSMLLGLIFFIYKNHILKVASVSRYILRRLYQASVIPLSFRSDLKMFAHGLIKTELSIINLVRCDVCDHRVWFDLLLSMMIDAVLAWQHFYHLYLLKRLRAGVRLQCRCICLSTSCSLESDRRAISNLPPRATPVML